MVLTKDMQIQEVVEMYPQTIPVFYLYGMGCIGCAISSFESIEEGALAHGIDVKNLMESLNDSIDIA